MAKPNLSQSVYFWLDLVPFLAVPLLCFGIVIILQVARLCASSGSEKAAGVILGFLKVISKMAIVVFGPPEGIFRYDPAPKEKVDQHIGSREVYIKGKKVHIALVIMMGAYVLTFGLFAIMVFWDIFLLSESHDCDDTTIDCFVESVAINVSSGPIRDCSLYEKTAGNSTSSIRITCYTFTYAFGAALGAIGGLLTMIRIVMKVISAAIMWTYENASDECKCCSCSLCCVITTHCGLILLIPFILPITFIIIAFASLSIANIIQIILFILTLAIGMSFPWCIYA